MKELKGIFPAMVTPFTKTGEIDTEGLGKLANWLLASGVDGLFPLGSGGEGPKLNREERKKVLKVVLDVAKSGVPVVPGTGGITTKDTILYTKDAKDMGASAAVIHPPWYFHPSPKALLEHYKTVAQQADFPIIIYNLPSFVGYQIPIDVVVEASTISNIVGIKDSSAEMFYFQALMNDVSNGFELIQGYGSLFLPSLVLGAKTTFCGEASIAPDVLVDMYRSYLSGDLKKAREMHFKLVTLVSAIGYGTFPVSIKEALNMLGLPGGYTLPPCAPLEELEREKIRNALVKAGLFDRKMTQAQL
jgi:4-hydroxy-tetrahydrodipicolinate synthase